MEMREYRTKCPNCLNNIILSMGVRDRRRNTNEFFMIECQHCKRQVYAKIFEKLVTYPHKLIPREVRRHSSTSKKQN